MQLKLVAKHKIYGVRAENFFASRLNELGIDYRFVDSWFDFLINKKIKVEVKSCQLCVRDGRACQGYHRIGRFDFTEEGSRIKQFKENIWICFILRHEGDFMLLGFAHAKKLKRKRYIALNEIRKLGLINISEWLIEINANGNGE